MQGNEATPELTHVEQLMRSLVAEFPGDAAHAAAFHLSAGGSRIRARLALHACATLGVPSSAAIGVAAACELLHNASLVHDDLQDRDIERRGKASVWREHGEATAICAGDLLLSAAYAALAQTGPATGALVSRVHRRVGAVIHGQCEDIALQGVSVASLAVYERVARGKSGPLLALPLELALALAGQAEAIDTALEACCLFAVGYQAADDLDDVDRDALNGELNIVAVLAASGAQNPLESARAMAIERFLRSSAAASRLPQGSGALLAAQADRRADLLAALALAA